jgi:hypothetical protein
MDLKSLNELKEQLAKDDGQITQLNVDCCFLSSATLKELISLARKCKNLKSINLKENYLGGGEGFDELVHLIETSNCLQTVDVRHNYLSYTEVERLIQSLKNNFTITSMKIFERLGRNKTAPFFVYLKPDASEDDIQWDAFTSQTLARQLEQISELIEANLKVQEVAILPSIDLIKANNKTKTITN